MMKKIRHLFIPVLLAFLIFGASCDKLATKVWAYYNETGCYEEWDIEKDDRDTKQNIEVFLVSHDIYVFEVDITRDADPCPTCGSCYTGRRVEAQIKKKDLGKIEGLGFKELE